MINNCMEILNHKDCRDAASCRVGNVGNMWYCTVLLGLGRDDVIPLAGCAVQCLRLIFWRRAQVTVVGNVIECTHIHSYLNMRKDLYLLDWMYFEPNTTTRRTTTRKQKGWNSQSSTLCRITHVKISGAVLTFADLQNMAELHTWDA